MAEFCLICLNLGEKLLNITEPASTDINLIDKLKICVPEIKWINNFQICLSCSIQLENAYKFRELCIKLKDARYKVWYDKETPNKFNDSSSNANVSTKIVIEKNNTNTLICFHCEKNFCSKTFLARHIKAEHKTLKNLICNICNKNFKNLSLWKEHEDTCIIKPEQEEYVGSRDLKPVENQGVLGNEQTQNEPNKCDICGTSFNNKYLLKRHKKNVHATEKNYKCDICPSSFVSPVYLNAHKNYHSGVRKHVCLFCGKRYITASDLYHHEKIHANKRAYQCPDCNKAFNTSSDLYKHKICVHMDRNDWKYCCEYCNRKFALKTNLDTHIKTHTGEKNFSCHLCVKKCISRSALSRHINSHSNVRSFNCTICDCDYKYQKSLLIHMVKNHGIGDVKIPKRVKKHFCHVCPRSYYANSKLQKHLRTHSGQKPFKCTNSEKCFIEKNCIKQHSVVTHNHTENRLQLIC